MAERSKELTDAINKVTRYHRFLLKRSSGKFANQSVTEASTKFFALPEPTAEQVAAFKKGLEAYDDSTKQSDVKTEENNSAE